MKVVLTNDDGIQAPGLAALESISRELGSALTVAPAREQSAVGHRVTLRTPIAVEKVGPGRISVDGTPVDCTRIALTALARDADWVVSGINCGGNLGVDVYMSGTVGAAREASLLGRGAIAISQYVVEGRELDWELTARRALPVIRHILEAGADPGVFWNVNLPHPDHDDPHLEWVLCSVDPSPLQVCYAREGSSFIWVGDYGARPRRPGSDVDVCFGGRIAVSRVPAAPAP